MQLDSLGLCVFEDLLRRFESICFSKALLETVGIVGRDDGYTAQVAHACVDHPDSESRHGYATLRSLSSGSMASARVSSQTESSADKVGGLGIVREGKPYPPRNLGEMQILPGVLEALSALTQAGYKLIVVTNQPDVARGLISQESVEEIHHCLSQCLPIDTFLTCFHDEEDGCTCRKPLPGALLAAAKKHTLSLEHSYMVGDRWRDIEAGQRAGCKTIFIYYSYKEKQPQSMDYQVGSLGEAATIILKRESN